MVFGSNAFLFAFLPIVLLGFFVLKTRIGAWPAQIWLTLSSIVFYGLSGWRFVPLLLVSIVWNFAIGQALAQRSALSLPRGQLLALGIGLDLVALAYFKYSNFVLTNIQGLTGWPSEIAKVELPVGISFYTFTQIAYLVDASRGE